jgi:hypothetical protein
LREGGAEITLKIIQYIKANLKKKIKPAQVVLVSRSFSEKLAFTKLRFKIPELGELFATVHAILVLM